MECVWFITAHEGAWRSVLETQKRGQPGLVGQATVALERVYRALGKPEEARRYRAARGPGAVRAMAASAGDRRRPWNRAPPPDPDPAASRSRAVGSCHGVEIGGSIAGTPRGEPDRCCGWLRGA